MSEHVSNTSTVNLSKNLTRLKSRIWLSEGHIVYKIAGRKWYENGKDRGMSTPCGRGVRSPRRRVVALSLKMR